MAAALADAAGLASAATMSARRRLIINHLERVYGRPLGRLEADRAVRRAFLSYARYWMESCRVTATSPEELDARMSAEGLDHLETALAAGKGTILALPHLGSWDVGGAWLAGCLGQRITVVVEPIEPPELLEWFVAMRGHLGMEVVPLGPNVAPTVSRRLRENRIVALVSDRDLLGTGVEVEFFGERTTLPAGPATLALRTGATLLPAAVYMEAGGRSHAVVRPPMPVERRGTLREDVTRITQALAGELEELIRVDPQQWHLFQPNWPGDPGYRA